MVQNKPIYRCFCVLVSILLWQVSNDALAQLIPKAGWSLWYVDSEELVCEPGGAVRAFDGNPATIWHTNYCGGYSPLPHELQINLGGVYQVSGFRYLPRQDSWANGRIGRYELYLSTDGFNWGRVASGTFANSATEKQVSFSARTAQFVRLRALSEVNGNPWTSMAELSVLGTGVGSNRAPNGVINTPSTKVSIMAGQTVSFTGTGTDPDGNTGLKYRWRFGTGSGVPDSTLEDPGAVRFNTAGTFTVSFTVTDAQGLSDPTPATRTVTVTSPSADLIPKAGWSLWYVDSEELVCEPGGAVRAFDGNPATIWHTNYCGGYSPLPHELQINLGGVYQVSGFRYLPRQDSWANGRIGRYELYLSTDGFNWGRAASGTFANSATEKQVSFSARTAQFVRLRALSEVNGNPWTSMAELSVLGGCTTTPSVKITSPQSHDLQDLRESTNLSVSAGACLDAALHQGWGVRFALDGGPAQGGRKHDDYAPPFATTFAGVSLAEHRISATIINSSGTEVSGVSTTDEVTQIGIGDYYVALGDSITYGLGDNWASDNTSRDGRNTGGGYEPVLNNLLTSAKGYPHKIANEGFPSHRSVDVLGLLPSVLTRHPGAHYYLILLGTNDWFTSIPSGAGLWPGQAGYSHSYKDYMQQIITTIQHAGKVPLLAKVPVALADCEGCPYYSNPLSAPRNLVYQEYNVAIDELVAANAIGVAPPDFFHYFLDHRNHFSDFHHPNGIGYQSMAQLWLNALP